MTDTTQGHLGATPPPRRNKIGLVEETPQTNENTPFTENEKHPRTVFGHVPDNFKPRTYIISEMAINTLKKVFTKAEKGSGFIKVSDLPALLEEVFSIDGQPAPVAVDVAYLLQKYNLESNYSQLDFTIFRQLILDLVSPKHHSLLENKTLKLKSLEGEKKTTAEDAAQTLKNLNRALSIQLPVQHRIKFDLEIDNPKRTSEFSPEGGTIAKRIFRRYSDPETGLMKYKNIFCSVSEVFEADNRLSPCPGSFVYLLQKMNINEGEHISLKTFKELLQELCTVDKRNPEACNYYLD